MNFKSKKNDNEFFDMYKIRDNMTFSDANFYWDENLTTFDLYSNLKNENINLFENHDIHFNQNIDFEIVDDMNFPRRRYYYNVVISWKKKRCDHIFRNLISIKFYFSHRDKINHNYNW